MRTRARLQTFIILGAITAVLACTLFLRHSAPQAVAIGDVLAADSRTSMHGPRAYVVFQLADCERNLAFLAPFKRPRLRQAVRLQGLLWGSTSELDPARDRLGQHGFDAVPLQRVDRKLARALTALGHRKTPFLFLLDRHGRLTFAASIPANPAEYVQLAENLERMALQPRS